MAIRMLTHEGAKTLREMRDAEIWLLRKEKKWTFARIGKRFGLSRQRVHQIIERMEREVE